MRIRQGVIAIMAMLIAGTVFSQTNLNFNNVTVTEESAIRLSWNSTSNEVYRVEYADQIVDTTEGGTAWRTLYDNYPSHGNNTFWLDTGNYNNEPAILHPKKMPMRFYRIVDLGPDTLTNEPVVSITFPTNGLIASGILNITVSASTDQPTLYTKLYVDGEEMPSSKNGTNFTINTCEWPNGQHTLFAVAESKSDFEGNRLSAGGGNVAVGHAVSAYVDVVFNNLVTRVSFSEPLFNPAAGQTQQVTSVFAANADWTLNIVDAYSNTVKTATGSGTSMTFDWDGTDNGGTLVPVGTYRYLISAQTNTLSLQSGSQGGSTSNSPPSPSLASSSLAESQADDFQLIPLPPLPPGLSYGLDSEGNAITNMTVPRVTYHLAANSLSVVGGNSAGVADANNVPPTPTTQITPPTPQRPPTAPIAGISGIFGIAYQRYLTNGCTLIGPLNGFSGLQTRVQIEGAGANSPFHFGTIAAYQSEANNFIKAMKDGGWSPGFIKVDDQLNISDLKATGSNIFNNVKLGLLMCHGTYGTTPDYTKNPDGTGNANGCQQIYFPIHNQAANSATYLRMSEMNLGSSGTNGLKWMAIAACWSLHQAQWQSMQTAGLKPFNNNLHLLLGTDSLTYTSDHLASYWAEYMIGKPGEVLPMSVRQAWYQAATDAYSENKPPTAMSYASAGFSSCQDEALNSTNTPSGGKFYHTTPIYTP